MKTSYSSSLLLPLLQLWFAGTAAQLTYLDFPVEAWRASFAEVGLKNGLFTTPDGQYVLAVASTGSVRAFHPSTGSVAWTFSPPPLADASTVASESGINFNDLAPTPYAVYAVTDTIKGNSDSACRVILINNTGQLYLQSEPLVGICAGTPTTTVEGRYVMVAHNDANDHGWFTILDTVNNTDGVVPPYFQATDTNYTFSPIGVFHKPLGGFYGVSENRFNTRDLFIWAAGSTDSLFSTPSLEGQMYAFQFPLGFIYGDAADNAARPLKMIYVGGTRQWLTLTQPVIANGGRNMYWSHTRAVERCWAETNFNFLPTNTLNLERGFPSWIAAPSAPVLSHMNATNPLVFGVGAGYYVWAANSDCSTSQVRPLDFLATSRPVVTKDDKYVAFAVQSGEIFLAPTLDITQTVWSIGSGTNISLRTIYGDLAMSLAGDLIFVADSDRSSSQIVAIRIATNGPTSAPTAQSLSTTLDPATVAPTTTGTAALGTSSSEPIHSSSIQPLPGTKVPTGPVTTRRPTKRPTTGRAPTIAPAKSPSQRIQPTKTTSAPTLKPVATAISAGAPSHHRAQVAIGWLLTAALVACWMLLV